MKKRCSALLLSVLLALSSALPARSQEPHVNVIGLIGDRAILRVDGEQVMLRRGESRGGVTLVNIEAGQAVLRVGQRDVRLGMGMDNGGFASPSENESVELLMNENGQFITSARINGRLAEVLVDTGANTVSMTTQDAKRLGIDYQRGTPGRIITAGGQVNAWGVSLQTVQVGAIVVRNVQANVRDSRDDAPILLGMSFLSQVSLQQENNRLRMTTR